MASADVRSRQFFAESLRDYGTIDYAADARELLTLISLGRESGKPYDLACIDCFQNDLDPVALLHELLGPVGQPPPAGGFAMRVLIAAPEKRPPDLLQGRKGKTVQWVTYPLTWESLRAALQKMDILP